MTDHRLIERLELKIKHKKAQIALAYADLAGLEAQYTKLTRYGPSANLSALRRGRGHEKIEAAVIAYAENGFSSRGAAQALGLNCNTINHRFLRLMELAGVDHRDYPTMLELYFEIKRQAADVT